MVYSLIPPDDRALALLVKRRLMAFVSYPMFLVPLVYSIESGWVRFGYAQLPWLLGLVLAINVGFLVAIRSRFSQPIADPSLTVLQMGLAGLFALAVGYYIDETARVITLMGFFTAFFFGVLPNAEGDSARLCAERLRAAVVALPVNCPSPFRPGLRITAPSESIPRAAHPTWN